MNLVNEAALLAARRNKRLVTMQEFEDAKDKVMMGAERRNTAMTQAEKELTAYHEAGHAVVALHVPSADPVHKATIIPRGRALGMVMQLPEGDRYSMSYKWMVSRLAIMMGGRVAEELKFGKENITSGASSDIEQATKLARAMVTQWGFSDQLGRVAYGENQQEVFLGHSVAQQKNVSEATAQKIDIEIRRLIDEAYDTATTILTKKKKDWIAIAEGLLEYETLSGSEIAELIAGKKPSRDSGDDTPPSRGSAVPTAGAAKKKRGEPDAGSMEPQPQG
jgi:cell division protease FtsH